jgi:hypothetical protein
MTKKYNLAILLPTRGRTHALDRSVRTLIDNAHNMDNVQIMFGFDRDDAVGLDHFRTSLQPELDQRGVDYVAVQFNPLGYININRYGNILAQHADADWYMFWNDDAIMETPEWDRIIGERTGEFRLLAVHTHNDHPYSIFPIVPAEWMDILGHLSPHQMIDAWLSQQAYMLDVMDRVAIYVTHDRHDLTGNNADATFKGRIALEGRPHDPADFHHIAITQRRLAECEKLAQYMASQGLSTEWWQGVKAGTQDPWAKLKDFDTNKQMVQFSMKVDPATQQVHYDPKNTQ